MTKKDITAEWARRIGDIHRPEYDIGRPQRIGCRKARELVGELLADDPTTKKPKIHDVYTYSVNTSPTTAKPEVFVFVPEGAYWLSGAEENLFDKALSEQAEKLPRYQAEAEVRELAAELRVHSIACYLHESLDAAHESDAREALRAALSRFLDENEA